VPGCSMKMDVGIEASDDECSGSSLADAGGSSSKSNNSGAALGASVGCTYFLPYSAQIRY